MRDRGHNDNQDALRRQEYAAETDHVIAVGRIECVGNRAEQNQHGILQGNGDADRRNQRQQFTAALAQGRKNDSVHQPSQDGPNDQRGRNAGKIIAAEQVSHEIGGERPQRDNIGVSKIDLDQHAINKGKPQRDQHVEAPHNDAVDPLLEDDGQHVRKAGLISRPSRTGLPESPCSGQYPFWCSGWSCRIRRCRSRRRSSLSQQDRRGWTGRPWRRDAPRLRSA